MARELVGAAVRYTRTTAKTTTQGTGKGRQERAWSYYRTPEVRSFANWIGNAMSKAVLFAGRRGPGDSIERAADDHPAARIVAEIAGGRDGQAQLLREYGRHLAVAGEAWTVIRPREARPPDWHVVSVLEMSSKGRTLEATIDGKQVAIPPGDDDGPVSDLDPVAIRVWDPSPEKHIEADSPVLASLDELEELRILGAAVRAIALSRLTGRGLLIVPKGTRFPTGVGQDSEDDLIDVFIETAATAIQDPDSAAATVPIILEVPEGLVGQIQRLTFESNFDELAIRLREGNIRRFATAADIPGEFLLGMGGINHWGAWELTSEAISLGIEPRLSVVTHAYTDHWLRPLLEAEGVPDAEEWGIFGDTSPLRVRTNRSQTALELYDRGAISARALRRETGFDEADAPDATDTPQLQTEEEPDVPTTEPRLPVDETTSIPDTLPAAALPAGALDAIDGVIWAALYTAGEKLKTKPACPRSERARARTIIPAELHTAFPVEPEQVDQWHLLDGAWVRVPEIAERFGFDPDCLTNLLDEYARALIAARHPHTYEETARVLRTSCLAAAV
ncbi:hypothetical protein [Streptomyces sp. DH12]|uniref:hypothetical protein n=1 Tax=Streptomyces sp. DH12 TaxID=2857010 RepID=UPI001E48ED20|nr:hypothetical protein [Streptomyces sp. DH12]